jgi:hypothetical protein
VGDCSGSLYAAVTAQTPLGTANTKGEEHVISN